jgi:hypothetical protein
MKTIDGPTAQLVSGQIIYQITLSSGMIITNPSGFGETETVPKYHPAIVSEDGRILSNPKPPENTIDHN